MPTSCWCATFRSIRIASITSRRSSARRISAITRATAPSGSPSSRASSRSSRRRLQTQEAMTAQIVDAIEKGLKPRGVAVMIEAEHTCMAMRGVKKQGASTVTTQFTGVFRDDVERAEPLLQSAARGEVDDVRATLAIDREEGLAFAPRFGSRRFADLHHRRRARRRSADGCAYERRGAGKDAGDRDRPLLVALARQPLAQGRHVRPGPDAGGDARRLRSGRVAGARERRRRRRRVPHRSPLVLLPSGATRRGVARSGNDREELTPERRLARNDTLSKRGVGQLYENLLR